MEKDLDEPDYESQAEIYKRNTEMLKTEIKRFIE